MTYFYTCTIQIYTILLTTINPAIFLGKTDNSISYKLNIYYINTETAKSVKLLGIEIDRQLGSQHISTLCSRAIM